MKRRLLWLTIGFVGIWGVGALSRLLPVTDGPRRNPDLRQITRVGAALHQFRLDVGRLPTESEGLDALMVAPAGAEGWRGPYLDSWTLGDSWGRPLFYRVRSKDEFKLGSYGSDGKPGGEGDAADIDPYSQGI